MRVMLELPNDPDLREAYRVALSGPPAGMSGLRLRLSRAIDLGGMPFAIVSLPSLTRGFRPRGRYAEILGTAPRSAEERLPSLVFSLEVEEPAALERLVAAARAVPGARAGIVHQERGVTYVLFGQGGHTLPEYSPRQALVFLGRA